MFDICVLTDSVRSRQSLQKNNNDDGRNLKKKKSPKFKYVIFDGRDAGRNGVINETDECQRSDDRVAVVSIRKKAMFRTMRLLATMYCEQTRRPIGGLTVESDA